MSNCSTLFKANVNTEKIKPVKYLLLLDINGCLCHRLNERATNREDSDFRYKSYNVYKRPNMEYFVRYLDKAVSKCSLEIYFYTSMMKHNAKALLRNLLPGAEHSHYQNRIFDRSWNINSLSHDKNEKECKRSFKTYNEKRSTMRDLSKIWERLPEFNSSNTIVFDTSSDKCKNYMANSIIIPPLVDKDTLMIKEDDTLLKMTKYLTQMFDCQPRDVRIYLRNHPFGSFTIQTHQRGKNSQAEDTSKHRSIGKMSDHNGVQIVSQPY